MSTQEKKKEQNNSQATHYPREGMRGGGVRILVENGGTMQTKKNGDHSLFCKCHKIHVEDFLTLRFKFRAPEKKCNKNGAWISIKNN